MNDTAIHIDIKRFRSPMTAVAAVFYALAALCGLGGAALLLDPGSRAALTEDIILSGIQEPSAVASWMLIHSVIGILAFLCPGVLALGMGMVQRGRVHRGMDILHGLSQWLYYGVNASTCLTLAVLAFRLVRYIIMCLGTNGGAYFLYTMLLSEAIMVAQAYLLFRLVRRFLADARECAASIGYTLSCEMLDETTYPGFAATGLLILGLVCLVLSSDRLLTLTIIDRYPQDYYKFLITNDPIQILTGCALALGAVGNFLTAAYLRRFKYTAERIIYNAHRQTL